MERFSRYNIFSRIKDSENYFILNLLTGNADILSADEASIVKSWQDGKNVNDETLKQQALDKGYWVDEKKEAALYRNRYLDFIDSREQDEIQIFFVPNYSCNFACAYCYQDEYAPSQGKLSDAVRDAFFQYITTAFPGRKKYITLFGGEPLLPSAEQRETIRKFLQTARELELEICVVTNGYSLYEFIPILKEGLIREVQVTLDGTMDVHDARRFLKGGGGTFQEIVKGIDACLESGFTVNLRMVIDKENIHNLPALAHFAIEKGWTRHPHFKTQIGRNYELHHCQSAPDKLFTRISLYEMLYDLLQKHPYIGEFYQPAFSISKFLAENGSLPDPLFDSCPACKTEWAFDYTGSIYPCTATVGKKDEVLGYFYPEVKKFTEKISAWEERDVTAIPECQHCSLQLACGGGCGSIAKNKNGKICSADCRPVKELLELGMAAYIENNILYERN